MKLTTDSSTLARIVLGVGALSVLSSIGADAASCVAGWEWSYSSKGDNPCEITEKLQGSCLGNAVYEIPPLPSDANYVTPQANDADQKKCQCNTVIYTLYAACSLCQSAQNRTPLTWTFWSQYCDNVTVTQYPFTIPYNTSVPYWAYLDDSGGSFDPVLAQAAGRDPEAAPRIPPIVSLSSTTPTVSLSSTTPTISLSSTTPTVSLSSTTPAVSLSTTTLTTVSSSKINSDITLTPASGTETSSAPSSTSDGGSGNSGGSKTNVGAIAGGVVGSVIGLAALGALGFFLKKRGERGNSNGILEPNPLAYNPAMTERVYGPPKLYNPADPSTFPAPIFGGDSSDSDGYQAGRYNGAAEL